MARNNPTKSRKHQKNVLRDQVEDVCLAPKNRTTQPFLKLNTSKNPEARPSFWTGLPQ